MNLSHRFRFLGITGLVLGLSWLLALGGFWWARSARMTLDKVTAYLHQVDLSRLSGAERSKALRELARRLNQLSLEERRKARLAEEWDRWFAQMTDAEKVEFLQSTLPVGVQQMISAFEQQPEEQRRKMVDDALQRLQEARTEMLRQSGGQGADLPAALLNEEQRKQIASAGLRMYYSQSSARTKAELAPVLEELQNAMQGGDFRGMRRRPHP
jgi:hypothetical protein